MSCNGPTESKVDNSQQPNLSEWKSQDDNDIVSAAGVAVGVDKQIRLMLASTRRANIWAKMIPEIQKWKLEWQQPILPWLNQMESTETVCAQNSESSCASAAIVHEISLPKFILRLHFSYVDDDYSVPISNGKDEWIADGCKLEEDTDRCDYHECHEYRATLIGLRDTLGFSIVPFNLWMSIFELIVSEFRPSTSTNFGTDHSRVILDQQYNLGLIAGKRNRFPNTWPAIHIRRQHYNPRLLNPELMVMPAATSAKNNDGGSRCKFVWLNWKDSFVDDACTYTWGKLPPSYKIYGSRSISGELITAQMERIVELTFDKDGAQEVQVRDKYTAAMKLIHNFKVTIEGYGRLYLERKSKWKSFILIPFYLGEPIPFDTFRDDLSDILKILGVKDFTHLLNWFGHCTKTNQNAENCLGGEFLTADADFTDLVYPSGAFAQTTVPQSLRFNDSINKLLHEHSKVIKPTIPHAVMNIVFNYLPLLVPSLDGTFVDVY